VINDLGVLVDSRMTFVDHIGSIESKSAKILGFIKRISREFNDPYTYKSLYVAFVRPGLEYASWKWLLIKRFIRRGLQLALRGLSWTT
jgi:hypothetical protein